MDVDGALVIGGVIVVEPPVVAEPPVASRNQDEVAGTGMSEASSASLLTSEHLLDARRGGEERCDFVVPGCAGLSEIHMSDLMIGDRESATCRRVDHLSAEFFAPGEKPRLAEYAVWCDRIRDRDDPVFAHQNGLDAAGGVMLQQAGDLVIEVSKMLRNIGMVRTKFLKSVVEVR